LPSGTPGGAGAWTCGAGAVCVVEADQRALDEAWWRLLRAETSCNFYWGEEWVHRCHADLDASLEALSRCSLR
jgi:hypothetical protein